MFTSKALIDNKKLEAQIAKNNKANEIFKLVADQEWNTLPEAMTINLNDRSVDLTIVIDLSAEGTALLEHGSILSSVFGKVPLYHLDGAASDATYSPDWNGNKIEELTTRYVDRTESDFLKTYRTFERNALRGDFMTFYSIVEGYKIRWQIQLTKEAFAHELANKKHITTWSNGDITFI
ncbi:hypothetical protein QX249_10380 [Vibrio parahaemolyticus]|uniref:Uncharacterized protein n=1 Tax=Vibrio parahaemolyticus TaxID=670 RepID=A0AAW8PXY3_VIBPH|nr:hypothetical protein [Vibrio parahaemolyticus]MDS1821066.1 hypothetical protein [Vibrio parahaemolyticus]